MFKKENRILAYLMPYWKQWVIIFVISLMHTVLTLANPLIIKFLIDEVLVQQSFHLLNYIIMLFIGISVFSVTTGLLVDYLYKKLELAILFDIRNELFQHLEQQDVQFFYDKRLGDVLTRITQDVGGIQEYISTVFNTLIINIFMLVITFGIAFLIAWEITALAIVTVIPIIIIQKYYGRIIRKEFKSIRIRASDFLSFLQERLSMVPVTKSFTREKYELRREKEKARGLIKKELQLTLSQSVMTAIIGMVTFSVMLFILWYGGVQVIIGKMTIGTLIAIYTYILALYGPIEAIADVNIDLKTASVSINRVFEFLDKKPKVTEKPNALTLKEVKGKIEFKNVSFSYPEKKNVLTNVSMKINPHETIAIVGPTGAGKTTIASLLTRLYDPSKGSVMVDGHDLRDVQLKSLRKNIGVVTQNTALFHASVRENIAYGKPHATFREITEAAKTAGVHAFIQSLPRKYETNIGEHGGELSGGEAQRIAIARAILKNPKMLILDEATAAVDVQTEKNIYDKIKEISKDRTVVIITHRLPAVQNADKIFYVSKNRIIEQGTFEELMSKKGAFFKMYSTQMKSS